jgi:hypothetical protein
LDPYLPGCRAKVLNVVAPDQKKVNVRRTFSALMAIKEDAMARVILGILLLMSSSIAAWAQQSGSYVYMFAGPTVVPRSAFTRWDGTFIHAGGGGEARLANRFGLGGELGVLKPVTNQYAITTGLASVTPAYHFIRRDSKRKFDPFVDGGFSVLFGSGAGAAIHYGGGLNYWVGRRLGLRLEFRHHLWSPEGGETVHLIGFRVGIAFR